MVSTTYGATFTMSATENNREVPTPVLDRNRYFDRLGDTEVLEDGPESTSGGLQIPEMPAAWRSIDTLGEASTMRRGLE